MPPAPKQKVYRALNWVSVRKSKSRKSPDWDVFIDWKPGDLLTEYPAHTAIEEWLRDGHIEEVDGG